MKCEICHQADAQTVLKGKINGEPRELYVCEACATAARQSKKKPRGGRTASITVIGPDGKAPPFVEEFFKAAIDLVGGIEQMSEPSEGKKDKKKSCPTCKATWGQLSKTQKMGCPDCWKTFAREIRKEVLCADYGTRHVGAVPASATGEDARTGLERELAAAVKAQDYEKAAAIQRRLSALDAKHDNGKADS